jgi:hypothetical protein
MCHNQGALGPTRKSSYYVAFRGVIKLLNIKILKYIKLITVSLKCNINSVKILIIILIIIIILLTLHHCKLMVINFMYFRVLMRISLMCICSSSIVSDYTNTTFRKHTAFVFRYTMENSKYTSVISRM